MYNILKEKTPHIKVCKNVSICQHISVNITSYLERLVKNME